MTNPTFQLRDVAASVLRGFLMGGADVVPGVSGGTVALIVGIYQRLVTAISHVDLKFLNLLWGRRWREAWGHVDLGFLISLGSGILLGIVGPAIDLGVQIGILARLEHAFPAHEMIREVAMHRESPALGRLGDLRRYVSRTQRPSAGSLPRVPGAPFHYSRL